jgi:hypothetical protein
MKRSQFLRASTAAVLCTGLPPSAYATTTGGTPPLTYPPET